MTIYNLYKLLPILFLFYSKFFYKSLLSTGSFNLNSGDISILLMYICVIIKILTGSLVEIKFYKKIYFLSLLMFGFSILGTLYYSGNVFGSFIIFLRRWLLMLIIPIYIKIFRVKYTIEMIYYSILPLLIIFILNNKEAISMAKKTSRIDSDTTNPNVFGMFLSSLLLLLILYKPQNKIRIINEIYKYFSILLLVYMIIGFSSRGAIIPLLFILMLIFIKKLKLKYLVTIIMIVVMFLILKNIFNENVFGILHKTFGSSLDRLTASFDKDGIVKDKSFMSRIETQILVLKILFQNFVAMIFGFGFDGVALKNISTKLDYPISTTDNQYFDILSWVGIQGLIIYSYINWKIYIIIKKMKKNNQNVDFLLYIFFYIILIGLAQDSFVEPTINYIYFILIGNLDFIKLKKIEGKNG